MNPRPTLEGPPDAEVTIGGRTFDYFGGTSYLGLHADPELLQVAHEALERFGLHPATSRAGLGETEPLLQLEETARELFGCEAALALPTGWAPTQALATLARGCDYAFVDSASHVAIVEAVRGLGVPAWRFLHRDPDDLRKQLEAHARPGGRVLVATDGIFPMSGSIAPLDAYDRALVDWPGATLLVDDAHGLGVMGRRGLGTVEHFGLDDRAFRSPRRSDDLRILVAHSLAKAVGGHGGLVVGRQVRIDALKERSGWPYATTPPTAPSLAASRAGLQRLIDEPTRVEQLRANVLHFRAALRERGFAIPAHLPSPVLALPIRETERARALADALLERGLIVPHLEDYPGLGPGGLLRVAIFATHRTDQLDSLADAMAELIPSAER